MNSLVKIKEFLMVYRRENTKNTLDKANGYNIGRIGYYGKWNSFKGRKLS